MARRLLFVVTTPLGYRVALARNRWREIIRFKHPALAGQHDLVRLCLEDPDQIRSSVKDPDVHLYYRPADRGYLCRVVGGSDTEERFVITAYYTQNIKQGTSLWTK